MNSIATSERQGFSIAVSDETKELIASSVAANTLRAYHQSLDSLMVWLAGRTLEDVILAEYLTHLFELGKSPATVAQVVAAVRWRAKYSAHPQPLILTLTESVLRGIRRQGSDRGRGQVDGLTWKDVERVCIFAETEGTVAGLRDSAMIRLMSDCLLRVSEVVSVNCGDLKSATLDIRSSKTDQDGVGVSLYVCEATRDVLSRYRERANITRGAVFRHVRRGDNIQSQRLTDQSARRIIIKRADAAGVKGFISGHSLRVGSAVSLAQAGLPLSICKLLDAGSRHRCRHTTRRRSWRNGARLHDTRTVSGRKKLRHVATFLLFFSVCV